ncbi:hypothetical protein ED733_005297 [Metarhizium rileyi]|uniref:FCP1 homology domain-containing protein n=1 Tax=Metarhizium rileyi (strain RCEF 4871) TaxID=1649241 RepID=A0A5C6GH38_METRR|nr:hypothetical protein ED733_005297 [Metarhizium rileyi]
MGNDGNQLSPKEGGTSKSGRGLLKVPSRSSSQQRNQPSTASTGLSGATVTDQRSSIDGRSKESRGSLPGRQRNGSASTNRTGGDSEHGHNLGNSQPSSPSTSEQKRRRRKNGGLLSLLGCCGVPDTANTVEEGENVNVHKVEKLTPRPTTAKPRPQAVQEQQSGKPLDEKETSQSVPPPGEIENQASSSTQEITQNPEQTVNESKQPLPPAVIVEDPSRLADEEAESGDVTEAPNTDDMVMLDERKEEPQETPVLGSEVSQPQTIPSPPAVSVPLPVSTVLVTETDPLAPEPQSWLLPSIAPEHKGRKCLVLDLDETLVHSSFKILHQADFTIPVEIEGNYHNVYVIKRPGVDEFMKRVGELYEVVVFTASVSKYGDPLLDQLDIHKVVHHRLFRESCYNHQGNYVKDLSQIGRDLKDTIIIDNSPTSYIFHPQHAVPISSWFSDAHDNELLDLIPVLEDLAGPNVADVSLVLDVTL